MAFDPDSGSSNPGGVLQAMGGAINPLQWLLTGGGILGGLLSGNQGPDMSAGTLNRLFGPGALSGDTQQLYQMLSQSPQFRQMLLQNSIQGGQFQNNLAQGLGQRGLSTSGIGTVANAAGQSAISSGQTALQGGLFGQAGNMAQQNLLARLGAYSQGQGMQNYQNMFRGSPGQQAFGSFLGALPSLFGQGGGGGQGGGYGGGYGMYGSPYGSGGMGRFMMGSGR